ncbi:MAG TPA: GRP family sugar transporter [Magnetospirillaceae bacterium]|nr:GRP family sugar transporter [Magnetospirillaceae bacterium]
MFEFAAVLFGLISAGSWGFADFFVGKSARTLGSAKAALLVNTIQAVVYSILYVLFLAKDVTFTSEGVIYALIGSIFFAGAQASFFKAMRFGPVGLVSSISSTYPLVALLVGVILFAVGVSVVKVVGIVFIVAGVMVASGLLEKSKHRLGKGPLVALLPAFGWGVGLGFISQALSLMDWQGTLLIELLVAPVVLLIGLPCIKGDEHVTLGSLAKGARLPVVWMSGLLQMSGLLALNVGIVRKPSEAAVIVAVSSCYPALTIFLALRHLKETIPLVPLIGGIVGIVGVIILALG